MYLCWNSIKSLEDVYPLCGIPSLTRVVMHGNLLKPRESAARPPIRSAVQFITTAPVVPPLPLVRFDPKRMKSIDSPSTIEKIKGNPVSKVDDAVVPKLPSPHPSPITQQSRPVKDSYQDSLFLTQVADFEETLENGTQEPDPNTLPVSPPSDDVNLDWDPPEVQGFWVPKGILVDLETFIPSRSGYSLQKDVNKLRFLLKHPTTIHKDSATKAKCKNSTTSKLVESIGGAASYISKQEAIYPSSRDSMRSDTGLTSRSSTGSAIIETANALAMMRERLALAEANLANMLNNGNGNSGNEGGKAQVQWEQPNTVL